MAKDEETVKQIMETVATISGIHVIRNVNAASYKMTKSLYDKDVPNLRNDILHFGRGAYCAVELHCPSQDSQMNIREMIEDNPSMTAFSTPNSALFKTGLLFVVRICGEVSPEILSRVSLVL